MIQQILSTSSSNALLVVRLTLAIVLFPHGAQKLLGWFNGPGFDGSMYYFTQIVSIPAVLGILVILIEFFGALLLFLGAGTRIIAVGVIGLFLGIMQLQIPYGFFVNWTGSQKGEGIEFSLLVIGMALALLLGGSGKFSVDKTFSKA